MKLILHFCYTRLRQPPGRIHLVSVGVVTKTYNCLSSWAKLSALFAAYKRRIRRSSMKTPRSLILALALGASLLAPAISQARVHVDVSLGVSPVLIAPPPIMIPPPVVVRTPAPVYYVDEPYYVPAQPRYAPPPPPYHRWHDDRWRDDRWHDDRRGDDRWHDDRGREPPHGHHDHWR
jgi:hypothetical protein